MVQHHREVARTFVLCLEESTLGATADLHLAIRSTRDLDVSIMKLNSGMDTRDLDVSIMKLDSGTNLDELYSTEEEKQGEKHAKTMARRVTF